MGWTFLPVDTLPEPGDIVWCKFPVRERPGMPGPWARPVLIRESDTRENAETGITFGTVLACYGTDNRKRREGLHFVIETKAQAKALGLHKPTCFGLDGRNVKHLLWCEEFFVPPDYVRDQGLIIGSLSEADRQAVSDLLAAAR